MLLAIENRKTEREFFVVPDSSNIQNSYKFRSETKKNKDKWIIHIKRQLIKEKLHMDTIRSSKNSASMIGQWKGVSSSISDNSSLRRTKSADSRECVLFYEKAKKGCTQYNWKTHESNIMEGEKKTRRVISFRSYKLLSILAGCRFLQSVGSLNQKVSRRHVGRRRAYSLENSAKIIVNGPHQFSNYQEENKNLKNKRAGKVIRAQWL